MEAHNDMDKEVNLHFQTVADWLESIKALMATVPESAQLPNSRIRPQKVEKTKASRISKHNENESILKEWWPSWGLRNRVWLK